MANIPRSPPLTGGIWPQFHYTPIYDKQELIGWQLKTEIRNWLPNVHPPRIIDHYHLQYYPATYNTQSMTLSWNYDTHRDVAAVMSHALSVAK